MLQELLLAFAPLFFVGLWVTICLVLSLLGGWRRVAHQYPGRTSPSGKCFRMQSGSFGWVNYGNCLNIQTSAEGIDVAIMLPFRLGHPPLFIPWEAVENPRVRKFLCLSSVRFDIGSPRVATIELPTKVFAEHAG
jgi:hypothetical protein